VFLPTFLSAAVLLAASPGPRCAERDRGFEMRGCLASQARALSHAPQPDPPSSL